MKPRTQWQSISSLDVFAELSHTKGGHVQFGSLANLRNIKVNGRGTPNVHTIVAVAISGDLIQQLMDDKFVGGLILCHRDTFARKRAEMEAAEDARIKAKAKKS